MCGVLGTINKPFDRSVLSLISHRGPDDNGIVNLSVAGHNLMLGHTRLSIVDLSNSGHQPMYATCEKYCIVYNGEIYNHSDLRRQLSTVNFCGHSDTETILYYVANLGIETVRKFNGIFAFAFVDLAKGKLFLVRDPFGVKPLYYCRQNDVFIFSSEVKPIRKLINDALDLANLAELLRLRYSPAPDTLFKNIKKVRPGHIIEVNLFDPHLSLREYPYLETAPAETSISFDEALDEYGTRFEQAVKRQLMSDVEVGVLLSGGVDSALVASYAQKYVPRRMKAFTIGFSGNECTDEIANARQTACILGMDHYDVRIGFDDFLKTFNECIVAVEEPLATTSIIPMFHLSKLASQHVKVVLSGQGADESLGGYQRYQGELYKDLIPRCLINIANPVMQFAGVRNEQLRRGLQSLGQERDLERFLCVYSVFNDEKIFAMTGIRDNKSIERLAYFFNLLQCDKRTKSVERMMSLDLRMNLSDDLLLYTDKITMQHSIECRVPVLDHDLVRFIESLPAYYRVRLRRKKIIHKYFARLALPDSIIKRKRNGFFSPTRAWFKKSRPLRDILLDRSSKFSSFINLNEVDKVITEHEKGFNRERNIFLLLGLYYWMAEFI